MDSFSSVGEADNPESSSENLEESLFEPDSSEGIRAAISSDESLNETSNPSNAVTDDPFLRSDINASNLSGDEEFSTSSSSFVSPSREQRMRTTSPVSSQPDCSLQQDSQERRSSARSVKRKKFADEIVESNLRPAYHRPKPNSGKMSGKMGTDSMSAFPGAPGSSQKLRSIRPMPAAPQFSAVMKVQTLPKKKAIEKKGESTKKRMGERGAGSEYRKKSKNARDQGFFFGGGYQVSDETNREDYTIKLEPFDAPQDLRIAGSSPIEIKPGLKLILPKKADDEAQPKRCCWAAMDDLKLVTALQQLYDFNLVSKYVSFSIKLDTDALEQRWNALLNNPAVCRETVDGLDKIPLDTLQRVRKMRFFSAAEEEAIKSILPAHATLDEFARLLRNHGELFFPGRTPEDLMANWKYLSARIRTQFGTTPPDVNPELPRDIPALRTKNRIDTVQTRESSFGSALMELTSHLNYRSKHIGCEVAYLKALGERVGSHSLPDQTRPKFQRDHKVTLAFLCGVCVDYAITTDEVTFGYSNEEITVELDLSLEGNIVNLQPLQGTIFLDMHGVFHLENRGGSVISISGLRLDCGDEGELMDNSPVDIGTLTFQFYTNPPAIKRHVDKVVADFANRARNVRNHFVREEPAPNVESDPESEENEDFPRNGNNEDDMSDSNDEGRSGFYIDQSFENLEEGGKPSGSSA